MRFVVWVAMSVRSGRGVGAIGWPGACVRVVEDVWAHEQVIIYGLGVGRLVGGHWCGTSSAGRSQGPATM